MRLPPLQPAVFLARPNRFTATVEKEGRLLTVHVPSSGRLKELLFVGNEVWVEKKGKEGRVTAGTLYLARSGSDLVCIHTGLTNLLALEAWRAGILPELGVYKEFKREVTYGESRFDLKFSVGDRSCLAEVKCVTLVREGLALFPDAPSERGRRHLMDLARRAAEGLEAAAIFVIQHPGGRRFVPNVEEDPFFARVLRAAADAGVKVMALRCKVGVEAIEIAERVPVEGE
ncbi:MAG: DNA/RNA nuclease SfsA [Bacillota bacterium]